MIQKSGLKVPLWIIVLIVALPQLSETIYTPSLPDLATGLGVTPTMAEYTLTTYLIGFAFGVLLWGRLSDRVGRKPGLFWGLGVYIMASIGCYLSNSIELLLGMRFLQAFGASVGSVLGQAIARDAIKPEDRGKAFSTVSIAMAFAPAIGPAIGGTIIQYTDWSNIFLILCVLALLIALQIKMFLPETHQVLSSASLKKNLFRDCIKQMIQDPRLLGFGFLVGGVNGILFGYFAESPFYFIESLNLTSSTFGILAFAICAPLAIGGIISKKMHSQNFTSDQIINVGIDVIIFGSVLFYLLVQSSAITPTLPLNALALSMMCIFIVMAGVTIIIPNCISQALENYGSYAGTAASLFGFYYYLIISAMTWLMALIHDDTMRALPLFFLLISCSMMIVFRLAVLSKKEQRENR